MLINALFVETNGIYFNDSRILPWDINKDAFTCKNEALAICHPPCKRWGRFWFGGLNPDPKKRYLKGDDGGCFAFSLWYVRTFGGVIEHPELSHAWEWFGLNKPPKKGGWIKADSHGGLTCCVEQGHYGHKGRKATWLYINKAKPLDLIWGKAEGKMRIGPSSINFKGVKRPEITKKERLATPRPFKEILCLMVSK